MARGDKRDADLELARECLAGNAAAWRSLVERVSPAVLGAVRATLRRYSAPPSPELEHDLYQQFFVALCEDGCRRLAGYQGQGGASLATWARVVAARLTIDHLRRQPPAALTLNPTGSGEEDQGVEAADPAPGPEEAAALAQREEFLRRELAALPARERLIMQLRFEQGMTGAQVARAVGVSRNNLDQIVHRIKQRLTQRAQEEGLA